MKYIFQKYIFNDQSQHKIDLGSNYQLINIGYRILLYMGKFYHTIYSECELTER